MFAAVHCTLNGFFVVMIAALGAIGVSALPKTILGTSEFFLVGSLDTDATAER